LAAALDRDTLARLERHLPDAVAARLQPPAPAHPGHDVGVPRPHDAQSGSVATWDGSRDDHTLGGFRGRNR
jgi:hypothetical protein